MNGEPNPSQDSQRSAQELREANDRAKEAVLDRLSAKYLVSREQLDEFLWIETWLDDLIERFGSLENLKDKKVLDLACGSTDPDMNDHTYEPWFPRIMVELGAKPVGIDIGPLEGESYEHYRVDLSKEGCLKFLPDKSFDIAHMKSLLGAAPSPRLWNGLAREFKEGEKAPGEIIATMKVHLAEEMKRLLKDDGVLMSYDYM